MVFFQKGKELVIAHVVVTTDARQSSAISMSGKETYYFCCSTTGLHLEQIFPAFRILHFIG
jgi:hypothetical protein